jgi:hypothetical protein
MEGPGASSTCAGAQMHISFTFVPLLFIAIVVFVIAGRLLSLLRGAQFSITDSASGKTVHLESPLGGLDLKPHPDMDPALAAIPVFSGATRSTSPAYEADIHFRRQSNRYIALNYSAAAVPAVVFDFYRNALPDWQEDRQRQSGHRLSHAIPGGEVAVEILGRGAHTWIRHAVAYHEQAMNAAAGNAAGSAQAFSSRTFVTPIFRNPDAGTMPGMDNQFGAGEIKPK